MTEVSTGLVTGLVLTSGPSSPIFRIPVLVLSLISRAAVVTPETRIGPKMDVFEIPEDESQDVDNFQDLISVAATLNKRKVGMYAEGEDRTRRSLELADEFYLKPDIYYDPDRTDPRAFGGLPVCLR